MIHRSRLHPSYRRPSPLTTVASYCLIAPCAFALSALVPAHAADGKPAESPAEQSIVDPAPLEMLREIGDDERVPNLLGAQGAENPDKNPLLNIRLTEGLIRNPATGRHDRVRLRSYVPERRQPNQPPFVAPKIEAKPGDTVRITLDNELTPEPGCTPRDINIPHCFNSTNLHSHGLWVSPSGNSDNVLITIRPKVKFEYEYNIPATHPAGTFWYHPHLHGSTALQVASGMAGALIIHGDRAPTPTRNGDIDTLLRDETGASYKQRVVLFQQVQYACRDEQNRVKTKMVRDPTQPDGLKVVDWVCGPNDVGGIEGYSGTAVNVDASGGVPVGTVKLNYGLFGPSSWKESNRYTSINGHILQQFGDAQAGRVERWRTIHAGVRDTIKLQFVPMRTNADPNVLRSPAEHDKWIARNCVGAPLPQFEIASDGLTHTRAIRRNQTVLQPGYRSDLLMVFPRAGMYCVIDDSVPAIGSISGADEGRRLLGTVRVSTGIPVGNDPTAYLTQMLTRSAFRWMPNDMKEKVVADLRRDLGLNAFVPHRTIETGELTPNSGQSVQFSIGGTPTRFMVNGQPYDPKTARTLILDNVEEWTLTSTAGSHPFHIHVNPFQISRILNAAGVDVSVPGSGDADYEATQGTWRDTLFVKPGFRLYVRTRYQRYIGEYVLHCHILDHEDQGMMQNIRVVLPDGQGGGVENGHGGHDGH